MEIEFFVFVISAVSLAIAVGYSSQFILRNQVQSARHIEELAGIQQVQRVELTDDQTVFGQVLDKHHPKKFLRILEVSGDALIGSKGNQIIQEFLSRGVYIQILLLDPNSDSRLFRRQPWLIEETKLSIAQLNELSKIEQRNLSVRFYQQFVPEILMFVDNEFLFLSSYLPVASPIHLVYEIRQGKQSVYELYARSFDYIWEDSEILSSV